jgi:ParB family chromosome partitioning protein
MSKNFKNKMQEQFESIENLNADTSYESRQKNIELRPIDSLRELPDNNLIPPLKDDDYKNLYESIRQEMKIRTPVHIAKDNTVLCGNNRLKIAREIGIKEIPVIVVDVPKEKYFFYALEDNLFRRQLNDAQKAELILMLKPEIQKEAEKRSRQNLKQNTDSVAGNPLGKTTKLLADRVGISEDYLKKYEKVKKEAPELAEKIKTDEIKLKQAYRQIKETRPADESKTGIKKYKADKEKKVIQIYFEDMRTFEFVHETIEAMIKNLKITVGGRIRNAISDGGVL